MRVAVLAGLAVAALWAAPASAHGFPPPTSNPAEGSTYPAVAPPTSVALHFVEPGGLKTGVVRVYDEHQRDVSGEAQLTGDHSTVVAPLPKVGAGSYVVSWRVTFADTEYPGVVHGAFTFSVKSRKADVQRRTARSIAPRSSSRDNAREQAIIGILLAAIALATMTVVMIRKRRFRPSTF